MVFIGKTKTGITHKEFSSIKYYKCNKTTYTNCIQMKNKNYFYDPWLGTRVVVDTVFDTRQLSRKEKNNAGGRVKTQHVKTKIR